MRLALPEHRDNIDALRRLAPHGEPYHRRQTVNDFIDHDLPIDVELVQVLHAQRFENGALYLEAMDFYMPVFGRNLGHEFRAAFALGKPGDRDPRLVGQPRLYEHGRVAHHVAENVAQVFRATRKSLDARPRAGQCFMRAGLTDTMEGQILRALPFRPEGRVDNALGLREIQNGPVPFLVFLKRLLPCVGPQFQHPANLGFREQLFPAL